MSLFKSLAGGALGLATGGAGGGIPASGPSNAQGGNVDAKNAGTFGGISPVAIGGFKSDGSAIIASGSTIWKWIGIAAAVAAVGYFLARKR